MSGLTDLERAAWLALDKLELAGCVLYLGEYGNGRPALQAVSPTEGPVCTVTVNLVDDDLGEGEFHVRFETRKHSGQLFEALIREGLAHPTGKVVSAGFVERYAEVWALELEGGGES